MERRHLRRTVCSLRAELISTGKSYAGLIENLCEEGICVTTDSASTAIDFLPGTKLALKFQFPSGETIDLHCEVRWLHSYKTPSQDLINNMGLAVIDPPQKYIEYLKTLK